MTETPDMFEEQPIARRRDPVTSIQAAGKYTKAKRRADVELVYDTILAHPGCTAAELSVILHRGGVDWYRAARLPTRRISDLLKADRPVVGASRKCDKTGELVRTYYAVP